MTDLGIQIQTEWIQIWGELVVGSQNNTTDKTNGVNNAVSCYKETVQFTASIVMSVCQFFTKFVEFVKCGSFIARVTIIKTANTSRQITCITFICN